MSGNQRIDLSLESAYHSCSMAAPSELVGQILGHYRILEQIGAGGMGVVYRAHDEQLERDVAVKVLPVGTLTDEAARKRFRKEALALAKLNHPNIATIFEFSSQNNTDYLVTEYISGKALDEKLASGALPEKEVVGLGIQLAQGLSAAHEHGIVHRDLKPANLRVTSDGRLKILDFGLAQLVPHASEIGLTATLTQSQEVTGTLPYMAPEQLRGEPAEARTDIWAAGAVLYEMATARRPFEEKVPTALAGDIIHKNPPSPRSLQSTLSPKLEAVILKCLEKDPSKRYQSSRELQSDLERLSTGRAPIAARSRVWPMAATGAVMLALLAMGVALYLRRSPKLTEKDTIVLADFENKTGDPVFDDTLKTALSVSLNQSPFLNVLSEDKVAATLKLMTRPPDTKLTPAVSRELCQRAGSKAYIAGSIASLGSQYVLGLKAVNCQIGDPLAQEQVTASSKEKVLDALGAVASKLRGELGESLATVHKFDVPLEQATTSSLEALKAYSLGQKSEREKGTAAAIPFFRRAIELDPSFASADQALGTMYRNLDQPEQAEEYLKRAVELSGHLSERERLTILASYYLVVTGEIQKGIQSYDLLTEAYPRNGVAYGNLGVAYASLGQYEKALEATREALQLNPNRVINYENLGIPYLALNRYDEARDITEQALARKLDDDGLHINLYALAFLNGDSAGMIKQAAWFEQRADVENEMLALESDTWAYAGHLEKARELTRGAVDSSKRAQNLESAALYEANAALREALLGNPGTAHSQAAAALSLAPRSRDAEIEAALAWALAGDAARAQSLERALARRFPLSTQMQSYWLPTIRAQVSLARGDPAGAIEWLQHVAPYDLANTSFTGSTSCMYPVYVRGQAYLAGHQAATAAAEFQKLLDHRGIVWNCSTGALARLGLARANFMQGDKDKARIAYQDFLTLWKDADPDIPVLKQAKAEYEKLR